MFTQLLPNVREIFCISTISGRSSLFLLFSIVLAVIIAPFLEYNLFLLILAFFSSFIVAISLFGTATVNIEQIRTCLGWGFINYIMFMIISPYLVFQYEKGTCYAFVGVAFFISALLIRYSSLVSYYFKLTRNKEGFSCTTGNLTCLNGISFYVVFILFFMIILLII